MSGRRRIWPAGAAARLFRLLCSGCLAGCLSRPACAGMSLNPALKLFFWIDPLAMIVTRLTAHAVPAAMLLSLGVIAATILLGRVFCGWICPLGTIHAAVGWIVNRVWPDPKRRDHWSPWQRTKYYLLAGFLAMAVLGGHWVCVFDPLCCSTAA